MSLRAIATAILLAIGLVAVPTTAQAAATHQYVVSAGGTSVKAIGMTVNSDNTTPSLIVGTPIPNSDNNTTASAKVASLLSSDTVTTSTEALRVGDAGAQLTGSALTEGLSILGGAIRADAVETSSDVTIAPGTRSGNVVTDFVNLRISGVDLPVDIRQNTWVKVPGVAAVGLNAAIVKDTPDGVAAMGAALIVKLLTEFEGFEAGTIIRVNPMFSALAPPPDPTEGPTLNGVAFGSRVLAKAGDQVTVESGPTARRRVPPTGTDGEVKTVESAGANVPGLLSTGAVTSTASGIRTPTSGEATTTNEVAELNILGGLITADVIKVQSRSEMVDGDYTGELTPTFVNLKVGNVEVPVDVKPNTVINVADLGRVIVNQQVRTANASAIRGLRIKLDTSRAGLPVGSTIDVAVAGTSLTP